MVLTQSKRNKSKNKQDLIKLESFCTAKETVDKINTTYAMGKKIFANDMTEKGLICKIYKQLL